MPLSDFMPHQAVVGAIGAGAIAGTLLASGAGIASADPAPRPPNCSAADVAGVAAGVATSLTTYLFTHPDVNAFYTGLQDQPKDQIGPRYRTTSAPIRKRKPNSKASVNR